MIDSLREEERETKVKILRTTEEGKEAEEVHVLQCYALSFRSSLMAAV